MGNNNFYVYVFLNQKYKGIWKYKDIIFNYKPFYIGIGVNYRLTSHFTPFNLRKKSIKNNIIKTIITELDELPIHYKIYEDLDEIKAKEIEVDLIKTFGKVKDSTGILSNLTDGGDGISGFNHSEKYKNSLTKKVFQYSLGGEFIKEWTSLKSVIDYFSLSGGNGIRMSIKNRIQCKGFLWSYIKYDKIEKHVGRNKQRFKYGIILFDGTKLLFDEQNNIETYFGRNVNMGNISSCCNGKIKTYLGFKWIKESI